MRALALGLVTDSFRLRDVSYERGEARAALAKADTADLVVASYMIGEIGDAERRALAELMWEKTRDTLLVVEPGTPAGYARIIALRERLIALGAHVAAPCPHDGKCPLQPPDWCHFTQRLQRSRAHKQVKGAELPFEDERFAYVALTRAPVAQRPSRVLAQPAVSKVEITAKLCTPEGLCPHKGASPRQSGLRRRPALAVGRCGDDESDSDDGLRGPDSRIDIVGVIPGWSEGPDLRWQLRIGNLDTFRVRCFASPRNDGGAHELIPPSWQEAVAPMSAGTRPLSLSGAFRLKPCPSCLQVKPDDASHRLGLHPRPWPLNLSRPTSD